MVRLFHILLATLLFNTFAYSDVLKPEIGTQEDSLKVGELITVSVSFLHPISMDVLFPDSTSSYGAFEFVSKDYINTQSDSASSLDSVIYTLRTFSV